MTGPRHSPSPPIPQAVELIAECSALSAAEVAQKALVQHPFSRTLWERLGALSAASEEGSEALTESVVSRALKRGIVLRSGSSGGKG